MNPLMVLVILQVAHMILQMTCVNLQKANMNLQIVHINSQMACLTLKGANVNLQVAYLSL